MPRGRTPREAAMLRRAVSTVEPLETRRMMVTLQGGDHFDYWDANKATIRIQLVGDIRAEFIAARVRLVDETRGAAGTVQLRDPIPAPLPGAVPIPGGAPLPTQGADLFHIYVEDAAPDAQILISQVTLDAQGNVVAETPFTGSVGGVRINGGIVNPDGGGAVYIGAREIDPPPGPPLIPRVDTPITFIRRSTAYNVRPAGKGIYAGIETAPGVSIGKIHIGGVVTGNVFLGGNIESFYAGDILTGDTAGVVGTDGSSLPNNFFVSGDIRNLLVNGSVGVAGGARTGTAVRVGGKLGYMRLGGNFNASMQVINNPEIESLNTPNLEINNGSFLSGGLNDSTFFNDSAVGAQFGSSYTSSITGLQQSIDFVGNVTSGDLLTAADSIDTYGLPMIAGQKVVITLDAEGSANVGIIDPLGRVVATDYPDASRAGVNESFIFTATLPGTYSVVVALPGDTTFTGTGGAPVGSVDYTLRLQGIGEVALGGATITGNTTLVESSLGVSIRNGDLGQWHTTGTTLAADLSTFNIARGNFREFSGGTIGSVPIGGDPLIPDLVVPRGAVGYLQADTLLVVNDASVGFDDEVIPGYIVGFDYQRVETAGQMLGNLVTAKAIGSVLAASIPGAPSFFANADRRGEDGRIDIIRVTGDFGSPFTGGPGLFTGPGGNVKYIDVGGIVYRDFFFGAFTAPPTGFDIVAREGVAVTLIDDSGARAIFQPTTVTETTGTTTTVTKGVLSYTPYAVRESGGVVLVRMESSTSVNVTSGNTAGSFDITRLEVLGEGSPVVYDEDTKQIGFERPGAIPGTTVITRAPVEINSVTFAGRAPVNVLNLTGTNLTMVNNTSTGEIVAIDADTLGPVGAQSLGYIKSSTAAEVLIPTNLAVSTFPFNPYSYGFNVTGPVLEVLSREAVGTLGFGGAVGRIAANADGRHTYGFEGINGPVSGENIKRVDVGDGIPFGGSGAIARSGIFAIGGQEASIDLVVANNADIRGPIGSEGVIGDIYVTNGSIIGAQIKTPSSIADMSFLTPFGEFVDFDKTIPPTSPGGQPQVVPVFGINSIRVRGNGGIIGSRILTGDFGVIDVSGFGILNGYIAGLASLNPNNVITADGLGIRNMQIIAGTSLNRLEARGDGRRLNVRSFDPSVLQSERGRFDDATGRSLSVGNDLHRFLGTSRGTPVISGVTNAGIMEDVQATGSLDLGSLSAYLIRSGANTNVAPSSTSFPMRVAFGNTIGSIKVGNAISGLNVRTGRLDRLTTGGNVERADISIAGLLKTVSIGGNMRGSAGIAARGPEGAIDTFFVRRGLLGVLTTSKSVKQIDVGSLGGQVNVLGRIEGLLVRGDVLAGSYTRASKGIGSLFVGGDVQAGATISAPSYGKTTVIGRVDGDIVVS